MIKVMPKWAKITIITLFILLALFDIWYFYLLKYAPNKSVLTTFNVSTLDKIENNDNYIIEFNYYANEDKAGVELAEFKLRYLTNENTTDTMEVGIQLVGKDAPIETILARYKHDWVSGAFNTVGSALLGGTSYFGAKFRNCETYKYNKYDSISYKATSEINSNSAFLITMGEDSFLMSFKGEQKNEQMVGLSGEQINNCYIRYDVNYMIAKLFASIKNSTMSNGTYYTKFEFKENMFNFQKSNGNNTFTEIITDKTDFEKIQERVVNYFTIKINTFSRGAVMASDSLFGMVENQANFNLTENTSLTDYHSKSQIIDLNEFNLEYIKDHDNYYNIKLNEQTKKELEKYSNCLLDIKINLDNAKINGKLIAINKVLQDDVLTKDRVYKIQTFFTNLKGEIVYTGVSL